MGIYQKLEDGYYRLVEKVDGIIPIAGLVDRIDKVMPSFIFFIIIIALIALGAYFFLLPIILPQEAVLSIKVVDDSGSALPNAGVTITYAGISKSAETKSFGEASFTTNIGASVTITAKKANYKTATATLQITEKSQSKTITLELSAPEFETKKIRLLSAGIPIVGRAELSFACDNARAPQIGSITTYTGEADVSVPSNCGKLYVSVKSDTYRNLDSYAFADQPIYLEPLITETGTINVSASFLNAPIAGIRITAYNEMGLGVGTETTNSSGQAALTLNAGNYRLRTYDPNNVYAQLESALLSLASDATVNYDFNLSKNIAGFVQIQVIDKSTKSAVASAQVQLRKENDDVVEVLTTSADANGIVKFNVADSTITYKAVIDHADYLIGKIANIKASSATYISEIEKFTGANGGTLKVKVVNESGKNVQNARVALYNADSGFLAGYGEQVTDINGIAGFTRVQNGKYYAFAYKSSASGKSESEFFDMRLAEDISLDVTMAMGDGIVSVNVTDVEGIAIAFAKVDVYDALDNSLFGSDYTDANGIYRLATKADKKVYVIVSKEEKADYISAVKSVIANTIQIFNVKMEAPIISGEARIKFLGLYKNEKIATSVASDEEYIAKFQLVIPEEKNYTEAGIHVRTGSALIMEKDSLLIKEINVPNATILKYTSYGNGYSNDVASVTSAEAKWFNATLANPKAGIYNAEATVLIKSTASITDKLTIDYRGWAKNGTTVRDKECTVATYDLYCTTYQQTYQLGAGGLCDDDFCFEASITDLKEEIASAVLESYQAKIYNRYLLSFTITNNSKTKIHNNANLRINNPEDSLLFDNYIIYDSEGIATSGNVNGYEFPWQDIGNFAPNSKVSGTLYFTTQKSNNAMVEMRMVSDFRVVFEKDLIIATSAPNTMNVKISPSEYPSGIENDITVTVKDAGTQLEIEDAIVKLKDRHSNLIDEEETAKDGTAKLTMPAQLPGEELTVEVSKPEYDFVSVELAIEDGVLSISPDSLGVSLNVKDVTESSDAFTLENLTHFPLKILSIELNGDFKGYVDIEKSNNWLFSYVDQVIVEESTFEASFKSYLTDSGKQLTEAQTLKGTMTIEAGNFDEKWVFQIPVTISIGIGKEVTPGCFAVTQSTWEAMTEGNPIVTEFQIQNGCAVDSTPVTLYNLRARVDWQTNEIGSFVLTVGDVGRELRSGYARTISNTLDPDASLSATITFSPFGGTSGVAKAKIVIESVNYSEHGEQVLSDEIQADITVVNLRDCIKFSKELLEMYSPDSDSFTIDTKDCGGTTSFTIRSDLEVTPTQLDLESSDTSSEIQVLSEGSMYGQYPIEVLVKGAGEKTSKPVITLRARVKPPADSCIQLNRFEYDVFDDPGNPNDGFDTSELTNQCYDAEYSVKLKGLRSWSDAFADGIKWGVGAMIMGMLQNMLGMGTAQAATQAGAATQISGTAVTNFKTNEGYQVYEYSGQRYVIVDGHNYGIALATGGGFTVDKTKELILQGGQAVWNNTSQGALDAAKGVVTTDSATQKQAADLQAKNNDLMAENASLATALAAAAAAGNASEAANLTSQINANNSQINANESAIEETLSVNTRCTWGSASYEVGQSVQVERNGKRINYQCEFDGTWTEISSAIISETDETLCSQVGGEICNPPKSCEFGYRAAYYGNVDNICCEAGHCTGTSASSTPETASAKPSVSEIKSSGALTYSYLSGSVYGTSVDEVLDRLDADYPEANYRTAGNDSIESDVYQDGSYWVYEYLTKSGDSWSVAKYVLLAGTPSIGEATLALSFPGFGQGGVFTQQGFLGGMFGNTKSTIGQGIVGMIAGTIFSYYSQDDKGTGTTVQKDVEITDVTLNELTTDEELDTDLNLSVGESQLEAKTGLLNTEERSVKISNISQREGVFFKIFNVQAIQHVYDIDKEYSKSVPDTLDIEEDKDAGVKFRLQFNAVAFDENVTPYIPPEALDCRSSTRTGITGEGALPKVKFDWDWSSIEEDTCNADNEDYVFCDATQFSIAVLKKIELIRNFLSLNAPFTCPSAETALSTKTQEIPNYDIGISSMKIDKIAKDVNVIVEIENRDPSAIEFDLNVTIRNTSTNAQQSCLVDGQNVLSRKTLGCYFANLADAQYAVSAEIDPDASCENCLNNSNSDSLASFFSIGTFGLELCEPYTTTRLRDFIEASESAGKTLMFPSGISSKEELLGMVDFQAYLMQDRFSPDFHADFHNYAMTISFFDAPSYYTDAVSGLGKYFSDTSRFKFAPKFAYPEAEGFLLNGPGVYNVDVNMTFDAGNPWELFDSSNEPIAEMRITLDKADVAINDSPLYYMPFDGLIGTDNSRVGYGLNYSGASILLNQSTTQPIRTIDISASTPIPNGTLRTTLQDDFTYLNNTEKGILLKITKTRDADPQLVYAPSYATPIMMQIENNEGAASALYSVSVALGAQDSGYFMAEWSGVGYNCKTFDGGFTVTDFANTKDIHALPTTNLSCTPIDSTSARTTYGFEFCEPAKFGNMFLKTLFYTPQQKENMLTAVVANDSVEFISPDASGSTNIPLNGVSGMENNQHGADTIDNMQDIFDLVKNELACVTSSSTSIDFWWNPKPVMSSIESEEIVAEKECIT